ncbi:MAG: RidA family protein [Fibrella sp.]|nr:RidA family protein [Armatimonadota bacterium]
MTTDFTTQVLRRLNEKGLELPASPPPPAGQYEPFRLHHGMGFLAAQTPGSDPYLRGRVGQELTIEEGRKAAEISALNALARIHQALGGFDRLVGLLHVAGHVASAEGFEDQPAILDGASELFLYALGERGKHSRTAYAPLQLPRGLSIELEITFAYRDS